MGQNLASSYAVAIQYQLGQIVAPVKVYASFNRNFATEDRFITWNLRNVHQPVYTGTVQGNKGIDRPIFQVNVFTRGLQEGFTLADSIVQALHGYAGQFGGAGGFDVAKVDVDWLFNTYDNDIGLHNIVLDCTMDVPT